MQLYDLTGTESVQGFRKGDFSPSDLVRACIERIEATEPQVKAWESLDAEGALRAANQMESKLRKGEDGAPLLGVPVGIKDVSDVQGFPTTANFEPYRGLIAKEDSGVARDLRDAGAIILGKTVTVQFAASLESPKTRNPWNLEYSPGGSSSGSAAAVSARQIPMATGTQTGGSVLRPSGYCGVVGLKPTLGRLSRYREMPVSWSFDAPGIIARSVGDAALMLQALARYDAEDPYSVRQGAEDFVTAVADALSAPHLGLMTDMLERAAPDVCAATEAAAKRFADAGAQIVEAPFPVSMDILAAIHFLHTCTEVTAVHAEQYATMADLYREDLAAKIEVGQVLPAPIYVHASRLRRRYRIEMMKYAARFDGLIGPTSSTLAPEFSEGTGDATFQAVFTLFGFPNISLPTCLGEKGLPHAVQIVCRPFQELNLLKIAGWAEGVCDPLPSPI